VNGILIQRFMYGSIPLSVLTRILTIDRSQPNACTGILKTWNYMQVSTAALDGLHLLIHTQVGLHAEETKPPIPGAGLCPGYTISRAILADAVCLTRGDRFLTVDFTRESTDFRAYTSFVDTEFLMVAFNLTTWGYEHCMVNKMDGSYGGMLTKLLFRMLPNHYPAGSVYAHFPFLTPEFLASSMAKTPRSAEIRHLYDWDRPFTVQPAAFVAADRNVVRDYERRLSNLHMPPRVRNETVRPFYALRYSLALIATHYSD
jgi:linoleate 10R-lipoxygenase